MRPCQNAITGGQALRSALNETLSAYQKMHIPVVLMADIPWQRKSVPKAGIRFAADPSDQALNATAVTRREHEWKQAAANSILRSTSARFASVSVLDVSDTLCSKVTCPWAMHNEFLYYDSGHLSAAGALQVYTAFAEYMNKTLTAGSAVCCELNKKSPSAKSY